MKDRQPELVDATTNKNTLNESLGELMIFQLHG